MNQHKENERRQCPACAREVKVFWNFCGYCGARLRGEIQSREYAQPYRNE